MDTIQLEYFQAVAKLQNMTKASELLHVSQPALSRAIARLETDLGVSLFEREGNRIRLGPHGVAFLPRVESILSELKNARSELKNIDELDYGDVVLLSFTSGLLNTPICSYLTTHPNVNFRHAIHSPERMQQLLERGEANIALSLQPIIAPNIRWTPVMEDEMIALVAGTHPLADRHEIDLHDLAGEKICLNCYEYGMHEIFDGFCAQAGFCPQIMYEGSDGDLCMTLLRTGNCVFLIPASIHIWKVLADREADAFHGNPALRALHINNPYCRWQYGIATSTVHTLSGPAKGFYDCLLAYFTDFRTRWDDAAIRNFLLQEEVK